MKRLNRNRGGPDGKKKKDWANSGKGSRMNSNMRNISQSTKELRKQADDLDRRFGFHKLDDGPEKEKIGWLLNMRPTLTADFAGKELSGIDLYFLEQDGKSFKVTMFYEPYFYVAVQENFISDVMALCQRKFESVLSSISVCEKEDLDLANHLSGCRARYLRMTFRTMDDLMECRRELLPRINKNKRRLKEMEAYDAKSTKDIMPDDFMEAILDLREYDVPYSVRVSIDKDIRVGAWYKVSTTSDNTVVERLKDMLDKAEPRVFAFDIECTKAPLKFPDAASDQIFMISYMVDGQGYLIISKQVVSKDIGDFEYTPKPSYKGPFKVFNERDEYALLRRFFDHIQQLKPHIFVTYNGDFFDWPFVETRAKMYNLDMMNEIGISADNNGEYRGQCSVHMDAFCWVKRDSYLPQGSQGLKAVTRYKLGYDPVEVDPELMVQYAKEKPSEMASYSVSDAVATYYLYEKYVHLFVFSLCTIIPMGSEDVLRKGSGTLCEALLMVEAFHGNIICPNKEQSKHEKYYKGHLVENETYIGGHVECLESGVFRADIKYDFEVSSSAISHLIQNIDRDLTFALEVELDIPRSEVSNYDEVRADIVEQLEMLRDTPKRFELPSIYHLDVAAMYPNIILTNRLQPCSIVDEATCASCSFNSKDGNCKREMDWVWRGDYFPASRPEYESIKTQLQYERPFQELEWDSKKIEIKNRLKSYCQKVYRKVKVTTEIPRKNTVCMRENPFYVNTVRAFRDRRYEYKMLTKQWKKRESQAGDDHLKATEASNKALVYDSLQLAHKCILNSFYGYVMRRGARWHSMEMAGIVTNTGSALITQARKLVEQIGRPLELDTDGIWCILPKSFPENFTFTLKNNGGYKKISYPCVMLNADVHECYTNHQYQSLNPSGRYRTRSECSIFFEVDGPYKCMVLPSSTEEGKLLKKRYAVFNFDGSLAELKGFELKRRGELQLIKQFQSQIFERFLDGKTLKECYAAVAECSNDWLDVIDSKGRDMETDELLELITENRSMSRCLADYGDARSTSITTAKRLGEFLGDEMVKDKGLSCKMVIASRPYGSKVTDRAIPTAIFSAEPSVMKHYLRRWLKDSNMTSFDIRDILDWDYYRTRLGSSILKIISLPAAFQDVENPVPRVELPEWMARQFREKHSRFKQTTIKCSVRKGTNVDSAAKLIDLEDISNRSRGPGVPVVHRRTKKHDTGTLEINNKLEIVNESMDVVSLEDSSFRSWLSSRKKDWESFRHRRNDIRQNKGSGGSNLISTARSGGITDFVTSKASSIASSTWQILEIQPLDSPGIFLLWALTESGKVQKVQFEITRTFYLNFKAEARTKLGKKVTRTLPRGHASECLHEVRVSERQYHAIEKQLSTILADPSILGVYECNVSLLFRALCHLGCVAKLSESIVNSPGFSLRQTFRLEDFEDAVSSNLSSFSLDTVPLRRVLLYITYVKDIAVMGLFFLKLNSNAQLVGPFEAEAKIWFVDPHENKKNKNNAGNQLPKMSSVFEAVRPNADYSCTFTEAFVVSSMDLAFSAINSQLGAFLDASSVPSLVLAQTPFHRSRIREKIKGLHSFPLCTLPWQQQDTTFPALTWRNVVLTRMISRVIEMDMYWQELVQCSQYSRIPVGNFVGDHSISIFDLMFSRELSMRKHLLWASPGRNPDLGELEAGEKIVFINEWQSVHAAPISCSPGAYSNICVQLDLDGLAVNTMLVADQVHMIESEGMYDGIQSLGKGKKTLEESLGVNTCNFSFKVLRSFIADLFKDLYASKNKFADHLLQNFYRWICSTSSLLYDPALYEMVSTLMEKLFLQLLAELRRLGAEVVYADFGKIIISTPKASLTEAETYCVFILETIRKNEMFSVLTLIPQQYWSNFLFMDIENFGGIVLKSDDKSESINTVDGDQQVVSHWNIANYLPAGVEEYFLAFIGQFIKRQFDFKERISTERDALGPNCINDFTMNEKMSGLLANLISNYFNEKLFQLVPEIVDSNIGSEDFPVLAGSHLQLSSPALEFTKFFCHVLELDTAAAPAVQVLRRGLFRLLNISEYSDSAKFENPSLSFILRDVICLSCNSCRNLDICRDPDLLEVETASCWFCPRCHAAYDKTLIEARLVEIIEQRSLQYQLQDMICRQCKLPRSNNLQHYCSCSGSYVQQLPIEDLERDLQTLRNVACRHGFFWLRETVEAIL